jgi:curved DNA-binding protein CbpA
MTDDPYAVLGVLKNADPNTIKNAYRRRARKSHPDAGGSNDEMAKVNGAYALLADPERRAWFDSTGEDRPARTIEDEASDLLMAAFSEAIDSGEGQFLMTVRTKMNHLRSTGAGNVSSLRVRIRKLEKRKESTTVNSSARNLAHMVIDQHLDRMRKDLERIDHNLKVIDSALDMLEAYACEEELPMPVMRSTVFASLATPSW